VEYIFAPWRYEYVSKVDEKSGCIFCEKSVETDERENLVLYREERCFAILNLFPYSTGHLMIAPFEHVGSIEDLEIETIASMMSLAKRCMTAIRDAFHPDGFNLGINIARTAGAGIVDHVHLHVVPRWSGDSNFMPVVGETRVLPLTLDQVWEALTKRLK
jgi:ATP adenylyltransferase